MRGQKIGYVRISSVDQNADRQLAGLELDKIFTDKASGKDTKRPELMTLLDYARQGDSIYIHSMDRLARNLDDLRKIVKNLTEKGIEIHFLKENLIFSGETTPMAQLLLSVMGAIAEFERSLIRERQLEGIEIAKKKGVYKGRKPALTDSQASEIKKRSAKGENKSLIAKDFNISRETLYKYLKK